MPLKKNHSRRRFNIAVALGPLCLMASLGLRAQAQIYSDPNDGEVAEPGGTVNTTATTVRSGTAHAAAPFGGRNAVFPFQLPTLSAGQTIATATLAMTLDNFSNSGFTYNVDLYGVGFNASSAISSVPFYAGALDPSTSATKLVDNFATTASSAVSTNGGNVGAATITTTGSTVSAYLNLLYSSGATGGMYAFFRLSPDYTTDPLPSTSTGYNFRAVETGVGNGRPTLNYTIGAAAAPEPTPLTFAALGAGAIGVYRRRRR